MRDSSLETAPGPSSVFVYGTLMRGECRAGLWPHRPTEVRQAWTTGTLYDLGAYPALRVGKDRVAGQLWSFPGAVVAETLEVLDAIEGYGQTDRPDWYCRAIFQCEVDVIEAGDGQKQGESRKPSAESAWGYVFADSRLLLEQQRILPDADGYCRWSGTGC